MSCDSLFVLEGSRGRNEKMMSACVGMEEELRRSGGRGTFIIRLFVAYFYFVLLDWFFVLLFIRVYYAFFHLYTFT